MLNDVQSLGPNWVIYSPTWTYTQSSPPILELVSGSDALWSDLTELIGQAVNRGLHTAVYPTPANPETAADWWGTSPRDYPWWTVWFERYRAFVLHHADLSYRTCSQALILGGEWITPALPGGLLRDGTPSGVPGDVNSYWSSLILEVRTHFSGQVVWAISDDQTIQNPPPFLSEVDAILIEFAPRLAGSSEPSVDEMYFEASRILDEMIYPFQSQIGKPVILSIAYPSADGAATACLSVPDAEGCLNPLLLMQPNPDVAEITVDLAEQADIYSAIFRAVNERPWINGVITTGYYPPAKLQDKSLSVHGKPAESIMRYWFPAILAPTQ